MLSCEVALSELTLPMPTYFPFPHTFLPFLLIMPAHLPSLPSSIHKQHFPLLLHQQFVILYPCLPLPMKHPHLIYCVPANGHFMHLQVWDPREIIFLRMMIPFSCKDSMLRLVTLKYFSMAATGRGGGMVHFISMLL